MTQDYLQVMIESIEKKLEVLDRIGEINKRQYEASASNPFDVEEYDRIMETKSSLIDELERLDEGFTSTYDLVKDDVKADPARYRDKVLKLQELVRKAIDKGVEVDVQEKRNKTSLDAAMSMQRKELKQKRVSQSAALRYYKAASKINSVDPQLMDRKK